MSHFAHFLFFRALSRMMVRDNLQISITTFPDFLAHCPRDNDAAFGGHAGVFPGVAVHQETGAAEGFGFCSWSESQHVRSVGFCIDRGASDGPVALRDGADVVDVLQFGIVLACACAGVSGGDFLAILFEIAGLLRVGPGKGFEVDSRWLCKVGFPEFRWGIYLIFRFFHIEVSKIFS